MSPRLSHVWWSFRSSNSGDTVHIAKEASSWLCKQVDEVGMSELAAVVPPCADEEE